MISCFVIACTWTLTTPQLIAKPSLFFKSRCLPQSPGEISKQLNSHPPVQLPAQSYLSPTRHVTLFYNAIIQHQINPLIVSPTTLNPPLPQLTVTFHNNPVTCSCEYGTIIQLKVDFLYWIYLEKYVKSCSYCRLELFVEKSALNIPMKVSLPNYNGAFARELQLNFPPANEVETKEN